MTDQIAVGLEAVQSFAINLDVIADRGGDTPGDGAIVADLDERATRNRRAPYFIIIVPFEPSSLCKCIKYQIDGNVMRRWGSLQSSAPPVSDRLGAITQLLLPLPAG